MTRENRKPRDITWIAGGPDPRMVRLNNASYVLDQFTSTRRLATLARIPTQAEVLGAIDTYRALLGERSGATAAVLDRLRPLIEAWIPCLDVPAEVLQAARELQTVTESPEPPAGWDAYDGYSDTWGGQTKQDTGTADSLSPEAAAVMQRTAKAAAVISTFMNLAGMLASPRVWATVSAWPSREHVIEHVDEYLAGIHQAGWADEKGQPPFQNAKAAVQRLRLLCETWNPGPDLPPELSSAARGVLAAFGLPEPVEGWDAFEGWRDKSDGA